MDRGYDRESLQAETEKLAMMNDPNARGARHSIERMTKELEVLHHTVSGLEEALSSVLVPEETKIQAGIVTADRIGSNEKSSPLVEEIDILVDRVMSARIRLRDLMERVDL